MFVIAGANMVRMKGLIQRYCL